MLRKFLITFVVLLSTGLFISCEKELDLLSEASLSTGKFKADDVDNLLNGLYNKLRNPNRKGFFAIMNTEIMSDNYRPVKYQWFQVQGLHEHKVPEADILLQSFYTDYYYAISSANKVIRSPLSNAAQKSQARYARALSYLRLYDLYERVPLVDENYDGKDIAPSSKEEVLDFIIKDLKYAQANGDAIYSTKYASKQAATALLARVYRIKGDIQLAAEEAESLITSGIFSLSANPLKRDSEVIFMLKGTQKEESGSWGWIMSEYAKDWNCFAAAEDLVALVKGDDTRKVLFDFENKVANDGYVYSKKYKLSHNSDLLVSRIAEMYLISAEAGNTNRLEELQAVRKSSLSLKEERRLEMSFEWTRWEDMKLEGLDWADYVLPYPQSSKEANKLLK